MIISGSSTRMEAMVTRFFCPKLRADTGQFRKGHRPQILRVSPTRRSTSSSGTFRVRRPRATSSKIWVFEIIWLGFCIT